MEDKVVMIPNQGIASGSPVSSAATESPPASVLPVMGPVTALPAAAGGGAVGTGDLVVKKKRGRPRKYDADGNLRCSSAPPRPKPPPPSGFYLTEGSPPSTAYLSGKRGRGRPAEGASWQLLASLGLYANTAGVGFTPHVITVNTGEDVASKIMSFFYNGPRGICILSANGAVSNVTIRQPGSSGGILTYEGRFEILSLSGSFTLSDSNGVRSRDGGLSVSLAGPDGRVVGGGIAGLLRAASPIQIVVGSFVPSGLVTQKRKYCRQTVTPPSVLPGAPLTNARPAVQAGPHVGTCPTPTSPLLERSQEETDDSEDNKQNPTAESPHYAVWNGSEEHGPSPDINISVLGE